MSIDCWWLFEKLHYYVSLVIFSILQLCIRFIFWSKDDDTITLFLYFWHLYKSTLWGFPFLNISTVVSMHVYMSWYAFILYKISFPSPLIRLSSPTCMQVQRMLLEQRILPFPFSSPSSNLCVTDLQHRNTKEEVEKGWGNYEVRAGCLEKEGFRGGPLGVDMHWQGTGELFPVPSPSFLISDDIFELFKDAEHFQWLLLYIQDQFWKVGKKIQEGSKLVFLVNYSEKFLEK